MIQPEFLEPEGVQRLHDRALLAYGGIPGLKDQGMLLSALDRPLNKLAYSDMDSTRRADNGDHGADAIACNKGYV